MLEVGMFTGTTTLAVAEAIPSDGKVNSFSFLGISASWQSYELPSNLPTPTFYNYIESIDSLYIKPSSFVGSRILGS